MFQILNFAIKDSSMLHNKAEKKKIDHTAEENTCILMPYLILILTRDHMP